MSLPNQNVYIHEMNRKVVTSIIRYLHISISGKMKGLAFIKDPDGYWIEILNPNNMK